MEISGFYTIVEYKKYNNQKGNIIYECFNCPYSNLSFFKENKVLLKKLQHLVVKPSIPREQRGSRDNLSSQKDAHLLLHNVLGPHASPLTSFSRRNSVLLPWISSVGNWDLQILLAITNLRKQFFSIILQHHLLFCFI